MIHRADRRALGRGRTAVVALLALALVGGSGGDDDDANVVRAAEPTAGRWKTWVLSGPGAGDA